MLAVPECSRPPVLRLYATSLLGALFLVACSCLIIAAEAPALKESTPAVKSALTDVINEQTAAFRANDYAKAYTFAAKGLHGTFTVDKFEQMVKAGYPIIPASKDTEFGAALDDGESGVVFVRFTDPAGKRQLFRYTLEHEPDGWKITGVIETEDTPSGDPTSA